MTDVKKRLVYSIVQFLTDELQSAYLSVDAVESLEVAIQCLENAYGIDSSNPDVSASLRVSRPLLEIFTAATQNEPSQHRESTDDEKKEAEKLKTEGNELMKAEKFAEALELYSKAIALDGRNAIYYSNRAAAHSKLGNHRSAIDDCNQAISIDPTYSKAYGRMGLAYASLNQHREAKDCYEKAVKLEPENDSYQSNLKVAEEKLKETNLSQGGSSGPGMGFDLGSLLNNPALMNMATRVMFEPNVQHMLGSLLSSSSATGESEGGAPGMEFLLQAGQQLAAQMQAANPNLVEQLRQQMNQGGGNPPNNDNSGNSQNNQGL